MTNAALGQPLADRVYSAVSDDIIAGKLAPGDPLGQEHLARRFSMSRTPVRDALTRLTTDGLVRLVPTKGYFVNDLSRNRVQDVYQVRYALESLALRASIGWHAPDELEHLRRLNERITQTDDSGIVFDTSLEFHQRLLAPCRNDYLLEVLGGVWTHPIQRRISRSYRPTAEGIREIAENHRLIVQHVEAGDADLAIGILERCHSLNVHEISSYPRDNH